MEKVTSSSDNILEILSYQFRGWLVEDDVDLLQSLILRFRHKQELVEPAEHSNTAVETQRQTDSRHCLLHVGEEICNQPRAEEECQVPTRR
jgi:hypothetical protein